MQLIIPLTLVKDILPQANLEACGLASSFGGSMLNMWRGSFRTSDSGLKVVLGIMGDYTGPLNCVLHDNKRSSLHELM